MQNTQIDPLNHEQQLAYELVANTNSSFFLTGRAGSGKTTFLHNVQKLVGKQFITLAPTGVAAILAGGDTIHSFFGLPMEICTPGTCGKMNEAKILTLIHADSIIIDEVSMVKCECDGCYRLYHAQGSQKQHSIRRQANDFCLATCSSCLLS